MEKNILADYKLIGVLHYLLCGGVAELLFELLLLLEKFVVEQCVQFVIRHAFLHLLV